MSSLSIGLVGLPNVGKSTLFNALTDASVLAANYPFATIEPNTGVVPVPDERLDVLSRIYKTDKIIPATVEFVDVAGLVAGASRGEGLGNKFLANIRGCDAICHIVRAFEDSQVQRAGGRSDISPLDDIEVINTELMLADIATIENHLPKVLKAAKSNPALRATADYLKFVQDSLLAGTVPAKWDDEKLHGLDLLTAKPVIYVFNVDEAVIASKAKQSSLLSESGLSRLVSAEPKLAAPSQNHFSSSRNTSSDPRGATSPCPADGDSVAPASPLTHFREEDSEKGFGRVAGMVPAMGAEPASRDSNSEDWTPSQSKTSIPDDADRFVSFRDGSAGRPAYDVFESDGSEELGLGEVEASFGAGADQSNVVFICAKLESELRELTEVEAQELLADYGVRESGLLQLARAAYDTLGLQSFLTAGEKEVRAWTIRRGATAPQAAGVIHTDFERGFIAAQVVSYRDLVTAGSESAARAAGKIRTEGKTYVMQPDDVVEFRFNV